MTFKKLLILIFFTEGLIFGSEAEAQNKQVSVIPFTYNNGHLIINVKLNDSESLNFLFDSGAGATLITHDLADSIGLLPTETRQNIGVSGAHMVGVIKGIDLRLGEIQLPGITLLSTESNFEELDSGGKIHGVIGYPLLENYVVEVNNERQELILYDRISYIHDENGISLPINMVFNLPVVEATVKLYNGKSFIGNFIVDTGARAEVIISSPTVVWYDMADNVGNYYNMRKIIGTSNRKSKVRFGRLASFTFGTHEFIDVPVVLSSDNKGVLADSSFDGIIGNGILSRYTVVFDYYFNMIHLKPNSSIDNIFIVNNTGFNIVFKGGKPVLEDIIERTPADKAGLRNGDEIIKINDSWIKDLQPSAVREAFEKAGERIDLLIKRNNELINIQLVTESLI